MKRLPFLLLLIFAGLPVLSVFGQLPPVRRTAWTTNAPGAWNAFATNVVFYVVTNRGNAPYIFSDDLTVGADDYLVYHDTNFFKLINSTDGRTDIAVNGSGYVGIGTNNPTSLLTLYAGNTSDGMAIYGSAYPQLRVGPDGGTFGQLYWDTTEAVLGTFNMLNPLRLAGSYVRVYTPGGERMRVTGAGDVGINTNAPQAKLHVLGSTWLVPSAYNNVPLIVYNNANAASLVVNSNGYVGVGTVNPYTIFTIQAANPQQSIYHAENSYGGIEIGPSTLNKYLDIRSYGSNVASTLFGISVSNCQYIFNAGADAESLVIGTFGNDNLILGTANAGRVFVTGPGLVGIGTNTPGEKLAVANVVANGDVAIELQNDVQNWKLRNMGTVNDDFRIYDATDSRLGLGIAAADGAVYVPNGLHSTNTVGTVVLGPNAGYTHSIGGTAIGNYAGGASVMSTNSVFIGLNAGAESSNCLQSVCVGTFSGSLSYESYYLASIGYASGYLSTNSYRSVFSGYASGYLSTNSNRSIFSGYNSGRASYDSYFSLFDGYSAGYLSSNTHHSIFLGNESGTNTVRPYTLRIDTIGKATNQTELIYGEFDTGLVKINDRLQVYAETNGVAPPTRVGQPVSAWAQLAYQSTNALDMVYETYTNVIVNATYDDVLTNHFYANPAIGTVTNVYAGFYEVSYSFSVVADAAVNGDELEAELFFDGVGDEHTASLITVTANTGFFSLAKEHAKYLPAGTRVELKAKNIADVDQDFSITRIVLLIKSL